MVVCKDSSESMDLWVGQITSLNDDMAEIHYWRSRSANWSKAVFKPAYVGSRSGLTHLTLNPQTIKEPFSPWVGQVDLELIVAAVKFDVNKKNDHKMAPASRRPLARYALVHL